MKKHIVFFTMLAASSFTQTSSLLRAVATIPAIALALQLSISSQQAAINALGRPSHTSGDTIIFGSILTSTAAAATLACHSQFKSARIQVGLTAAIMAGDLVRRCVYKKNRVAETAPQQTGNKKE